MKRLLLILMALMLLTFVSCKKETKENNAIVPEDTNTIENEQFENDNSELEEDLHEQVQEIDYETKALWSFDKKEVGDWPLDTPYINPFYTYDAYEEVVYLGQNVLYVDYVDDLGTYINDSFYGEIWEMIIPFNPDFTELENLQLLYDMDDYLDLIGATTLGRYQDAMVFSCFDEDKQLWIGSIVYENERFILSTLKYNMISEDQMLTITPDDLIDNHFYAASINESGTYYGMKLSKSSGDAYIRMVSDHYYGNYRRYYDQFVEYESGYGEELYVDNLPYDNGLVRWDIEFSYDNPPEELSIELIDMGSVPSVNYGQALGAIKVSAEYVKSIDVIPTSNQYLSLSHEEFYGDLSGLDKTPDGDFIVYLPAGLWDVNITPNGDALVSEYVTSMVPVNAGQMTEVVIPNNVSKKLRVTGDYDEQGLEIKDVKEASDYVSLRFTILDQKTKSILPDLTNTVVYDGGYEGSVTKVTPVEAPAHVVLLLDSSGSMKGQMDATLDAANQFIEKLPDDTLIQVIDFDSKPKLLEGTTKEEASQALTKISVGGATTLHDAVINGLDILKSSERPNLILFTDGFDANLNDTDIGSEATFDEMMTYVKDEDISIYTIGFGENHDSATLDKLASTTGGMYYPAKDQEALNYIFDAINSKLLSTFDLEYVRPTAQSKSDIPVISMVIDTSGSMNEYTPDGSYRLLRVKQLLHHFLDAMTIDAQYILTEFNDGTRINQTITTEKPLILRSLASLEAGGGTDIEGSVQASFESLKHIPSSKKVMIYITDAALGTRDASEEFLKTLDSIKESDITVLWVGMGVDDEAEDFILAAEISEGSYVISEDAQIIKEKLDVILNQVVSAPTSELVNIFLSVEKENESGVRESFTTSKLMDLTPKKQGEEIVLSETIHYNFSDIVKQYDPVTAEKVSSDALPVSEVIIRNRMSADKIAENEACQIHINEVYFIDRLNGVNAPDGYQFISLDLDMVNILPEQEVMVYPDGSGHPSAWVSGGNKGHLELQKIAYQIPNFISHFYLTYNAKETQPASTATWLMGQPIVNPGHYSLTLQPDQTVSGLLTFLVKDETMNQASLHLYDTNYGHIDLPIVGQVSQAFELESLPLQAEFNLSETFGLSIFNNSFMSTFKDYALTDTSTFELVKGNFTSNVQALLDINPAERMKMKIASEKGDYYLDISPLTVLNPGGFYQPRMMAPGAQNYVNWIFHLPSELKSNPQDLFIDLYDQDQVIEIQGGQVQKSMSDQVIHDEYFDLYINDYYEIETYDGYQNRYIVLDITIDDFEDGYATSGVINMLMVAPDDPSEAEQVGMSTFGNNTNLPYTEYSDLTHELLLGFTDETVVYDGTNRRGFVIFDIPDETTTWHFYSPVYESFNYSIDTIKSDKDVLAREIDLAIDSTFEEELSFAINEVVNRFELNHPEENEKLDNNVGLDTVNQMMDISTPMISGYGNKLIEEIKTYKDLLLKLKSLEVIPSSGLQDTFQYNLSPQALLTQGYGTEQDLAHLAYTELAKMGYNPKLQALHLTPKGKEMYSKLTPYTINNDLVPGIKFNDGSGHLLIIPFMVLMEDVDDLAILDVINDPYHTSSEMTIQITLSGEYTEHSMNQQFSDMSDALTGETEVDRDVSIEVLYERLEMATLSLDAIDFGFGVNGSQGQVYLNTADGEILGDVVFNPDYYDFHTIEVTLTNMDGSVYRHQTLLEDQIPIEQVFMTVSLNAPDINPAAYDDLQNKWQALHDDISNPSPYTALRWYDRNMIHNIHAAQYNFNQALAGDLDLKIGHIYNPKIIIVSNQYNKGKFSTHIDMLQAFDEIFSGPELNKRSFNIMSGIYASSLESKVIENGYGLEEIWDALPDNTELYIIEPYPDDEVMDFLTSQGYPEDMIEYIRATENYIILPEQAATLNDKSYYAWYECEPNTYKTISVLNNYTHGAGIEATIIDTVKSAGQFALGAFKGVETSIWSVAVFSLEEDDYDTILKNAKALALGLADGFGVKFGDNISGSIGGTVSASQSVGPINFTFDGSFDVKQGVLGYTEGYIEGVKLYFDIAK